MSDPGEFVNTALIGEAWSNAELAMLVVDDQGRYVATNRQACTLTGYTHRELLELRAGHDLAGDEASTKIYAALERERRMQGRKVVKTKTGELIRCRYWGIRTTVGRLPYFVLLLWPPATTT